ncbi:MAG: transposase [Flavobacteriales bacterium]|nr:transposase [Flavobacteriales bacterium]
MKIKQSYSSTDILNHLKKQGESSQTVSSYCTEHDIKTMTFYKWRSRHKATSSLTCSISIKILSHSLKPKLKISPAVMFVVV